MVELWCIAAAIGQLALLHINFFLRPWRRSPGQSQLQHSVRCEATRTSQESRYRGACFVRRGFIATRLAKLGEVDRMSMSDCDIILRFEFPSRYRVACRSTRRQWSK